MEFFGQFLKLKYSRVVIILLYKTLLVFITIDLYNGKFLKTNDKHLSNIGQYDFNIWYIVLIFLSYSMSINLC